MNIIQMASITVCTIMLALIVKGNNPMAAVMISIAGCLFLIVNVIARLSVIIGRINLLTGYITVNREYMNIILKVIGICYVTQFTSDICRDSGFNAIASQLEIFCKLSIAAISLPVIIALFDTITKMGL